MASPADAAIDRSTGDERVLTLFWAGLAVLSCGWFFYFVERTAIRIPAYDMLDWLRFYNERMQAGDWIGYLWTPHNEHRLVFTRILIAVDVRFFNGEGTAFACFDAFLLAATIATSWSVLVASLGRSLFAVFAYSVALILLTPTYVVTTISMPGPGAFLQTPSFALFSIALLDGSRQSRYSNLQCPAAIICACFASFGVTAGLLIWPVLVWLTWRNRLSWARTAAMGAAGLAYILLYLWKMPARTYRSPVSIDALASSFDYAIRFLGLPWSHAPDLEWPARAIGATNSCCWRLAHSQGKYVCALPENTADRLRARLVCDSLRCGRSRQAYPYSRSNADPLRHVRRLGAFRIVPARAALLAKSVGQG